jgi:hypothetical protein
MEERLYAAIRQSLPSASPRRVIEASPPNLSPSRKGIFCRWRAGRATRGEPNLEPLRDEHATLPRTPNLLRGDLAVGGVLVAPQCNAQSRTVPQGQFL